ncbi:Flagellar motor switch protein FliN [Roseivivax jejudonensis]|uniref:Flagellar motor switch protein FliN n=1 Tax=Roseivivax jejudonensis TaxID=1529041 RepID=A0A1X6ZQE5_9RHOB|nr:FliM/FliN family flagellar motor switch protein [Roseivivax jejudonensis]SLN57967.1 Flagellar motor switch protein FliN [Roseivivax jejudonensis]
MDDPADPQTAAPPGPQGAEASALAAVPIEVTVSVGRARPLIRDLLRLDEGSVLTLDKQLDDPVELYVGDRLIGTGALEVFEEGGQTRLAVRLTEVADLKAPA